MPHFSEEAWADFVRGVGAADRAQELDAHLTAGCPECKADFDLWRGMERFAARESNYAPPENLVRLVKLGLAGSEASESEAAIASLVYDSLLQPLAAGVRSGSVSTRQLVFESEGLTVDLRFERQPH